MIILGWHPSGFPIPCVYLPYAECQFSWAWQCMCTTHPSANHFFGNIAHFLCLLGLQVQWHCIEPRPVWFNIQGVYLDLLFTQRINALYCSTHPLYIPLAILGSMLNTCNNLRISQKTTKMNTVCTSVHIKIKTLIHHLKEPTRSLLYKHLPQLSKQDQSS